VQYVGCLSCHRTLDLYLQCRKMQSIVLIYTHLDLLGVVLDDLRTETGAHAWRIRGTGVIRPHCLGRYTTTLTVVLKERKSLAIPERSMLHAESEICSILFRVSTIISLRSAAPEILRILKRSAMCVEHRNALRYSGPTSVS
jgi:hypothetical protein